MTRVPTSLGSRLVVAAILGTAAAMVIAGAISWIVLDRFVHRQVDLALDNEVMSIASVLSRTDDGALQLTVSHNTPPYSQPRSGWYWQVITEDGETLSSPSLEGEELSLPKRFKPPPDRPRPERREGDPEIMPIPFDGPGPHSQPVHMRILRAEMADGTSVRVVATAPASALSSPVFKAMMAVLLALGIAAIVLTLSLWVQVRLGLRPLDRLRADVAEVRSGRRRELPEAQPDEVRPLVDELNKLIIENEEGLARARRHVSNLAHGLKTPLASLSLALMAQRDEKHDPELEELLTLMDRRIRHHLARARAAALSGGARARSALKPRLRDLTDVLEKIHADRNTTVILEVPDDIEIACEAQDLDEMLGNLLDNSFRFARTTVRITATEADPYVVLSIEDDGPGFGDYGLSEVLKPGVRLDESGVGFGFGLPIARELAELYGGELTIGQSELGGARIDVRLPRAMDVAV